jgi:hypothetical protein
MSAEQDVQPGCRYVVPTLTDTKIEEAFTVIAVPYFGIAYVRLDDGRLTYRWVTYCASRGFTGDELLQLRYGVARRRPAGRPWV